MRGELVERGGESERLLGGQAVVCHDPLELGVAEGERAGLVEQNRARPAESLDAARPLTITPAFAARERPDMSAIGAARISGHGVATTKTASARTGSPERAQATAATSIVAGRKKIA